MCQKLTYANSSPHRSDSRNVWYEVLLIFECHLRQINQMRNNVRYIKKGQLTNTMVEVEGRVRGKNAAQFPLAILQIDIMMFFAVSVFSINVITFLSESSPKIQIQWVCAEPIHQLPNTLLSYFIFYVAAVRFFFLLILFRIFCIILYFGCCCGGCCCCSNFLLPMCCMIFYFRTCTKCVFINGALLHAFVRLIFQLY